MAIGRKKQERQGTLFLLDYPQIRLCSKVSTKFSTNF